MRERDAALAQPLDLPLIFTGKEEMGAARLLGIRGSGAAALDLLTVEQIVEVHLLSPRAPEPAMARPAEPQMTVSSR